MNAAAAMDSLGFDLDSLRTAYANGVNPRAVVAEALRRIGSDPQHAWIQVLRAEQFEPILRRLEGIEPASLPLFGLPFAIKDNIDLAGVATTAACAQFAYQPVDSAFVVARLIAAGAVPIGKTNLDQFATGLNGTRSPYGACRNAFDGEYISGGSSSGSAVAVALGQVSFALGTDTAGSGRVPAAFNNIVGLKPTRGWLSTRGVVPCCPSLDCVSIFALTADDAERIFDVARAYDALDPWSRADQQRPGLPLEAGALRVGIPTPAMLQFFGDVQAEAAFARAVDLCAQLGASIAAVELDAFREAAELLYGGAWVAERYAAIRPFFESQPGALLPVTRSIIGAATGFSAADTFDALHRLQRLRRSASQVFERFDCLLLPTAPRLYTIAELQADPVTLNSNLGYYTNFMNLLDLAGVAVPAAMLPSGLPFGITLVAPAGHDRALLRLAARWQGLTGLSLGATGRALPARESRPAAAPTDSVPLAVCGAHMAGLPLNWQLRERGARLLRRTTTAPQYRLHALPGDPPRRPGLVRVTAGGNEIEVEVWQLPVSELGSLVAELPAPLAIGKIVLRDGSSVSGFVCEAAAAGNALDISSYGGWRGWLQTSGTGGV